MHRFEIFLRDGRYSVYIDGKELKCGAVDLRLRDDEIPSVKIDMISKPEVSGDGLLELSDNELLKMIERKLGDREFCDKVWKMISG